jgi:hypothetical protein
VLVTAQDDLCIRRNGAFQNAVIRRVGIHCVDTLGGRDGAGEDPELPVGLSEFVGRVVELVSQDAESFFKDGVGNR